MRFSSALISLQQHPPHHLMMWNNGNLYLPFCDNDSAYDVYKQSSKTNMNNCEKYVGGVENPATPIGSRSIFLQARVIGNMFLNYS